VGDGEKAKVLQSMRQLSSQCGVLEYAATESNSPDTGLSGGSLSPSAQAVDQTGMKPVADASSWFSGQPVGINLGKKVHGIQVDRICPVLQRAFVGRSGFRALDLVQADGCLSLIGNRLAKAKKG